MIKEYFTAKELAGVAGMPNTRQGIHLKAKSENWQKQKVAKGKGFEYHLDSLPAETRHQLLIKQAQQQEMGLAPTKCVRSHSELWEHFANRTDKQREVAAKKLKVFQAIMALKDSGVKISKAIKMVAEEDTCPWSFATLRDIYYGKRNGKAGLIDYDKADWWAVLVPYHKGRQCYAEFTEEAWQFIKKNYLRAEKPNVMTCYQLAIRSAEEHNWKIPSYDAVLKRINKIPTDVKTLAREGSAALIDSVVPQRRTVTCLQALEVINGDGYMHNVFIKMPNQDTPVRVKTWFWQDVYSRKIIAWRTDETENSDMIRLAFGDVLDNYGIPKHIVIDNTRAAANKWLTGRVKNRYRFKVKEDDPKGLFPLLNIETHWTTVNFGKGHGQAKPIERAFGVGGLGEYVDKHPKFAGAYTGKNTSSKPYNYGEKSIPYDLFLEVLESEINAWNQRVGRKVETSINHNESFDDIFKRSYESSTIKKATENQRYLWLLSAESVTVKKGGVIELDAGKIVGFGSNRYNHDRLLEFQGKKVVVKFDPANLHKSIIVQTLDGLKLCEAECIQDTGFLDRSGGRAYGKLKARKLKSAKAQLQAEIQMDDMLQDRLIPTSPTPNKLQAKAIEPVFINPEKDNSFTEKQQQKNEMEAAFQEAMSRRAK